MLRHSKNGWEELSCGVKKARVGYGSHCEATIFFEIDNASHVWINELDQKVTLTTLNVSSLTGKRIKLVDNMKSRTNTIFLQQTEWVRRLETLGNGLNFSI